MPRSRVKTEVYASSGTVVGRIEELIVDPAVGIVRFARIRTCDNLSILMPWAAMVYAKSRGGFFLTDRGEFIVRGNRGRQPTGV